MVNCECIYRNECGKSVHECRDRGGGRIDAAKQAYHDGYAAGLKAGRLKWIPVTERLPKVGGVYCEWAGNRRLMCYASDAVLVCEGNGTMFVSWIMAEADDPEAKNPRWMDAGDDIVDIEPVAWMPLPEPYKPKEEGREQ